MRNSLFVIIVILSAFFSMYSHAAAYSAGTGTSADPYQIASVADWQTLMATSTDWNKYFALTADINLSGVTVTPIGNATTPFSGTFDGNGHIISNVVMNTPDMSYTGLFGWVANTGQILNLGVENVNILGQSCVGGLVGINYGAISLCHATGTVAGISVNVGGLVGANDGAGAITSCYAACTVSGSTKIGGFAGFNFATATITFSYATGAASGENCIGGMVGIHHGTMTSCYATGPVSASGFSFGCAGGLIGYNEGSTTTSCYATGAATATDAGGAIGLHISGTVNSCFWDTQTSGNTAGVGSGTGGGLTGMTTTEMQTLSTFTDAGWDFVTTDGDALDWKMPASGYPRLAWELPFTNGIGTPADPYQIASVADWQTFMATSITWNKYFILTADIDLTGITVTPVGNTRIKDFGGTFDGQRHVIRNVTINMSGYSNVGLFGWTDGPGQIKNLGVENITVRGSTYVGGLVGDNLWNRPIIACYVTGSIQGASFIGGLVGRNYSPITSCYTACTVTGTSNQIGGLVGQQVSTTTSCYAAGTVTGVQEVGGLVGWNRAAITDCYTAGTVTGSTLAGAVVGNNSSTVSHSFWDTNLCGLAGIGGGTLTGAIGLTTAQMQTESTFTNAGWDFSDMDGDAVDWEMSAGNYPHLAWESFLPYSGGSGTAEDPYRISSIVDWQRFMRTSADWNKYFALTADIDLSGVTITPIGNETTHFSGTFDGDGHIISNVVIDTPDISYTGLFGWVDYTGRILNLGVENVNILGQNYVGGLVGYVSELAGPYRGTISLCHVTGTVASTANNAGGLVGMNYGAITSCYTACTVSGKDYIGGFAGENWATITFSYATGAASGENCIGGMVGIHYGTMTSCYAAGAVSGVQQVGGLVGWNRAAITNCYTAGTVTGSTLAGAVVGNNSSAVSNSFWDKNLCSRAGIGGGTLTGATGLTTAQMQTESIFTGAGWDFVTTDGDASDWKMPASGYPRLAWELPFTNGIGTSADPYQIASVADWQTFMATSITWNKYFILTADIDLAGITVTPVGNARIKDFGGTFDGQRHVIRNVTINMSGYSNVGLFGWTGGSGQIKNLGVENITVRGSSYVGGLVGANLGNRPITACYVTGTIQGVSAVGGLTGWNYSPITSCYTTCTVTGTGNQIGGLVGQQAGTTTTCYAAGTVTGVQEVGGLVGWNRAAITNCYAAGTVTGSTMAGAVVGNNSSTVSHSFWDTNLCGLAGIGGGTLTGAIGLTTAQMETESIFTDAGWDFSDMDGDAVDWQISAGNYPHLAWEPLLPYSGGRGTAEGPYRISSTVDWQKLMATPADWDSCFILMADMDLAAISVMPVGNESTPYTGTFDGNGHSIRNIIMNIPDRPHGINVGLFGYVGTGGQLKNVHMENVDITGVWSVGGLAGWNSGTITFCDAAGSVSGARVGGLVGYNAGAITSCYAMSTVDGSSGLDSGGLVGRNNGTITSCYAKSAVTGIEITGGLVGGNGGTITSCYAMSAVAGIQMTGGLVGENYGAIMSCYAKGSVSGNTYTGGLIGSSYGIAASCYAESTVTGSGDYTGGLVGVVGASDYEGALTACYATGSIQGVNYVAGLVGFNYQGKVIGCYSTGTPVGTSTGGLCAIADTGGSYEDTGNFWDMDSSLITTSAMGTGKTTSQMLTLSTFTYAGWDFVVIDGDAADWMMLRENEDYPRLIWQTIYSADIAGLYGVDLQDLIFLAQNWLTVSKINADIVDDSVVNLIDWSVLSSNWMMTGCGQCNGADLSGDENVDMEDLTAFMNQWLCEENANAKRADMNQDGIVDFGDLAILSAEWMTH